MICIPEFGRSISRLTAALIGLLVLGRTHSLVCSARAADEQVSLEFREPWSAVFQGSQPVFHAVLSGKDRLTGRFTWSHSVGKRTIARGEADVDATVGREIIVPIRLSIPEGRAGVVYGGQLAIAVSGADSKPISAREKLIWVFPRDPFADRSRWLEQLRIQLYDPGGSTAELLERVHVPFRLAKSAEAFAEEQGGIALIGEGVSLVEQRSLGEQLQAMAHRGRKVLCLAPAEGQLPVIAAQEHDTNDDPALHSLSLRRADVITELDKRLDTTAWADNFPVLLTTLQLKADQDKVVLEVTPKHSGWSYTELRYPQGRLAIVGFGIVKSWDANPTPRYLFAKLLEQLGGETKPQE